jgi:2-polyprenyl-3-methyl-5-hydroxy-6-metoxy-1,4-benzoquinol methylase
MMSIRTQKPATEPSPLSDAKIVDSWHKNAAPWAAAIRDEQIESRKLITNNAIIEAVASRAPKTALDIGCGEGWLAHRLAEQGVDVLGTDVVPELIAQAKAAGKGRFQVASYEEMAEGKITGTFDVAVCNFALLGKESVDGLFSVVPRLLNPAGAFIVQTIHPVIGCGEQPYVDGWRQGSWAGFSADFTDPAPWYFRTIETWVKLFTDNGLTVKEIREPVNPKTQKAASIIFVGEISG